tara:strand:- start:885 stop:1328 length:444 start_codon:yes stop_codon:yes gene_type:complete
MKNKGPSVFTLKAMNFVHRSVIFLTFGRIGWQAAKMPVIELVTTGRKSGRNRSVMLTSPHQQDASLLIVASKGGSDTPPEWFLNIEKESKVRVRIEGASSIEMRAEVLDGIERDQLWPAITSKFPNYGDYQSKTSRVIPLVFLHPVS